MNKPWITEADAKLSAMEMSLKVAHDELHSLREQITRNSAIYEQERFALKSEIEELRKPLSAENEQALRELRDFLEHMREEEYVAVLNKLTGGRFQ